MKPLFENDVHIEYDRYIVWKETGSKICKHSASERRDGSWVCDWCEKVILNPDGSDNLSPIGREIMRIMGGPE